MIWTFVHCTCMYQSFSSTIWTSRLCLYLPLSCSDLSNHWKKVTSLFHFSQVELYERRTTSQWDECFLYGVVFACGWGFRLGWDPVANVDPTSPWVAMDFSEGNSMEMRMEKVTSYEIKGGTPEIVSSAVDCQHLLRGSSSAKILSNQGVDITGGCLF